MTPVEIITLAQFAVRFGLEAAEAISVLIQKESVSPEEVNAAFALAKKGEADYKQEARERAGIPQP